MSPQINKPPEADLWTSFDYHVSNLHLCVHFRFVTTSPDSRDCDARFFLFPEAEIYEMTRVM